jgi:polysaccharide biosynthesis transport protein
MNSWDRVDDTTGPAPTRSRQNANHTGARSRPLIQSEGRVERYAAMAPARAPGAPPGAGLGSRLLRAHLAWILLIALAVTAGAYVVAKAQKSIYTSHATVVVFAESASAASQQPVVMATERGIVSSQAVLSIASRSAELPQGALESGLAVTVPVDTDLLDIAFSGPNPIQAQRAAEGIAEAYVAFRTPAPTLAPGSKTPTPAAPGAVRPSLISDATLPKSPTSPNRLLDVGVGLILGLALGVGVALVRDAIDDRLRGPLDLATEADAPVLALVPAFRTRKRFADERLVIVHSPQSRVAEAYRDLRTRVLQAARERNADTLLVTSATREDRATVAANLAAALALSGRRVILICADLRRGRTHELFGLTKGVGLSSVLSDRSSLGYALRDTDISGLRLLSAGPSVPDPGAMVMSPALPRLLGELRGRADFVVIDAPPVLASADTEALAQLSDLILLVADARLSTRAQVRAAMYRLGPSADDLVVCVLDNVGRARRLPRPLMTPAEAAEQPATAVETPASVTAPAESNGHSPWAAEIPSPTCTPLDDDSADGERAAEPADQESSASRPRP